MSDLQQNPSKDLETIEETAGASRESMLITTDSIEEITQELSASLEDEASLANRLKSKALIQEIQETIVSNDDNDTITPPAPINVNAEPAVASTSTELAIDKRAIELSETGSESDQEAFYSGESNGSNGTDDYLHDTIWLNKREHIFVISSAGKPIYSLHGNEDKLATLCGVMQALVSVVHANQDILMSIHANDIKFVFLVKGPLILVAASRRNLSVQQIHLQLTYVNTLYKMLNSASNSYCNIIYLSILSNYIIKIFLFYLFSDVHNQILSILTLSQITRTFEKRKNYDLRRLLAGSERLIDHLFTNDSNKRANNKSMITILVKMNYM